ncbi:cytochrome b6-F complex iron-sulfur subunit [Dissulfurispira thermophila]|uniref:Cytochrome b6-F complex iron-sulfur subunit n=1 Tax=Dissulfurispira thermophila TaxID=2715679 RepID=A0A7G1GYF4_9BACT|nr:ubiquinol-cytochrome c reductase iron-sulfur subunit [Dissulfurispira thermophila]BCB95394.1 cytochrome b6-F complex iron-sulfur subunit [Dissulfurispira thermophila]
MKRRDFLKKVIKAFFLTLTAFIFSASIYIYPSNIRKRRFHYIYLMDEDDLPKKGVRKIEFHYEREHRIVNSRVFVVAGNDKFTAFSPVCTHLGCLVNWDNNKKEFLCPCHGGKYNASGEVIAGPPPKPLTRLPLEIKDGKVYVGIKV